MSQMHVRDTFRLPRIGSISLVTAVTLCVAACASATPIWVGSGPLSTSGQVAYEEARKLYRLSLTNDLSGTPRDEALAAVLGKLESASRNDPASPLVLCRKGQLLLLTGKRDAARACFVAAMRQSNNYPPAFIGRALCDAAAGDRTAALNDLDNADKAVTFLTYKAKDLKPLAIDEPNIEKWNDAQRAQFLLDSAWQDLTWERFRVIEPGADPKTGDAGTLCRAYAAFARAHLEPGGDSIAAVKQVRAIDPNFFPAAFELGQYALETGDLEEAIAMLEPFTTVHDARFSNNGQLNLMTARALTKMYARDGHDQQAIHAENLLKPLLKRDGSDPNAWSAMADLYVEAARRLGDPAAIGRATLCLDASDEYVARLAKANAATGLAEIQEQLAASRAKLAKVPGAAPTTAPNAIEPTPDSVPDGVRQ